MTVIGGETRQQHRGRYVAYDLAGRRAHEQRRQSDQRPEGALHRRYAREVAREHEKGAEGKEQCVVHFQKGTRFQHEQRQRDAYEPHVERKYTEHDEHGERKQHEVYERTPYGRRLHGRRFQGDGLRFHEEARCRDEEERDCKRQRHYREKLPCAYGIIGIKIQVLRIAEGGQHAAEIGGDILHYEHERRIFRPAAGGKHEPSEREEGDESHIVRHHHGTEVSHEHQRESHAAHISECADDLARQPLEEMPLFERTDDRERAKQTGQRVKVEVIGISGVGRHKNTRHCRRRDGDEQHDVTFGKIRRSMQDGMSGLSAHKRAHEQYIYSFLDIKKI